MKIFLRDTNVISGSGDLLRNAIGGFYYPEKDDLLKTELIYVAPKVETGGTAPGPTYKGVSVKRNDKMPHNQLLSKIFRGKPTINADQSTSMFTNIKMPISLMARRIGNSKWGVLEDESRLAITDEKWKTYILGGTFDNVLYPGIYRTDAYDVNSMDFTLPYDKLRAKSIFRNKWTDQTTLESTSVYNMHIPEYQNFNNSNAEPNMLNAYDLVSAVLHQEDGVGQSAYDFLTVNGSFDFSAGGSRPFKVKSSVWPALLKTKADEEIVEGTEVTGIKYQDEHAKMLEYLNKFVKETDPSKAPNAQTLFMDKETFTNLQSQMSSRKKLFPFYNSIQLPRYKSNSLNQIIVKNEYSNMLLKNIKDAFVDNVLPTQENAFVQQITQGVRTDNPLAQKGVALSTVSYKYLDFKAAIASVSNFPNLTSISERLILDQPVSMTTATDLKRLSLGARRKAPYESAGFLRYHNRVAATNVLQELSQKVFPANDVLTAPAGTGLLNSDISHFMPYVESYPNYLMPGRIFSIPDSATYDSIGGQTTSALCEPECVAFRIRKINLNDNSTQDIIIQNQPSDTNSSTGASTTEGVDSTWEYVDTQVKYGTPYEYQTYAYMMVVGYKYEYSDLRLSRVIDKLEGHLAKDFQAGIKDALKDALKAKVEYEDGTTHTGDLEKGEYTCIEFYDPTSDLASPSPIKTSMDDPKYANMQPFRISLRDAAKYQEFSTPAQELAFRDRLYYADFNITIEPTIRLFEIPLHSKTLTVLDNPPPPMDVIPYQYKDQSQRIGFYVKLDSFSKKAKEYPMPLNSEESVNMANYLASQNMLDTEKLRFPTKSKPTTVEIYRLSKKPTSIQDFNGNLIATKDLTLNSKQTDNIGTTITPACFYEESITTDHKFYYVFRFLNENKVPGPWSEIIEAQLVDDGGYIYSLFKTISPKELSIEDKYNNPFKPFKKILKIQPALPQFNLLNVHPRVNFDKPAASQFDDVKLGEGMEDTPWNKTYKFRLTSKKTGKKIDLNVTYNVGESKTVESL